MPLDSFLFSLAAQARNIEMIEPLLTQNSLFIDLPIHLVYPPADGVLTTNLVCWAVRERNRSLLQVV